MNDHDRTELKRDIGKFVAFATQTRGGDILDALEAVLSVSKPCALSANLTPDKFDAALIALLHDYQELWKYDLLQKSKPDVAS